MHGIFKTHGQVQIYLLKFSPKFYIHATCKTVELKANTSCMPELCSGEFFIYWLVSVYT